MKRFIPYEKLSKQARRQLDRQRRATWGELNPVTRRPENPKAYNRKKHHRTDESGGGAFSMCPG